MYDFHERVRAELLASLVEMRGTLLSAIVTFEDLDPNDFKRMATAYFKQIDDDLYELQSLTALVDSSYLKQKEKKTAHEEQSSLGGLPW